MAKTIASQDLEIRDLKNKLQAKEHELIMTKADLCRGCQYRNDYKNLFKTYKVKEKELEKAKELNHCMSGQMDFIKSELELKLSAEIKNKNCVIEELKRVDKQKDKWREEAEKLRNTLNEIEKKCSKYQTCITVLKKDILDIINGVKDKNVLHKEKETK